MTTILFENFCVSIDIHLSMEYLQIKYIIITVIILKWGKRLTTHHIGIVYSSVMGLDQMQVT